jgi:hypothetical protein
MFIAMDFAQICTGMAANNPSHAVGAVIDRPRA